MASEGYRTPTITEEGICVNISSLVTENSSASERLVSLIIASTLMTLGVTFNFLAFFAILASKNITITRQGVVAGLIVSDLLWIGLGFPFIIAAVAHGGWPFNDAVCRFQGAVVTTAFQASASNIALIAFNRYFCIVHFGRYKQVFNRRNTILMMVGVWVYAFLITLPAFGGWVRFTFKSQLDTCIYDWAYSKTHTKFVIVAAFFIPLGVIIFSYVGIVVQVVKSNKAVQSHGGSGSGILRKKARRRYSELRLAAQLVVICVVFIVCWSPFLLLVGFIDPDGVLESSDAIYETLSNFLAFNFILDPIIYFFFNKAMRSEVKHLLCCGKKSTNITTANSFSMEDDTNQ